MSAKPIKMKELEARTGLGREAIRFYIREGMLPEPEKPKRNVAYYTEAHVKRLLAIRRLKEERALPLARIKSVLASPEAELLVGADSLQGLERLLPALLDGVVPAPDRPLDEVAADGSILPGELAELAESGVISPVERDGRLWLDFRDAAILRRWSEARRAGFTRERGYDLTMLKRYREVAAALAEIEVDQFLETFTGTVTPAVAAETAARGLSLVNDILVQLHVKAVLRRIEQRLAG